jgi:hypothetical protein
MRAASKRLRDVPRERGQEQRRWIVQHVIEHVGSYQRTSDEVRIADVAREFGCSHDTVARALRWAKDSGVLTWEPPTRPGGCYVAGLVVDPSASQARSCGGVSASEPVKTCVPAESPSAESPISCGAIREDLREEKGGGNPPAPHTDEIEPDGELEWWDITGEEKWLWPQNAGRLAMDAAENLGCPYEQWFEEPAEKRNELERRIVERHRQGEPWEDIFDALTAIPAPRRVEHWAGLLLHREAQPTVTRGRSRRSA